MDYAMFSTRERTGATYRMSDFSASQVLFSEQAYDDSWYSDFFKNKLTAEKISQFRTDWLSHCANEGCDSVWLCIDGSNNDCAVPGSSLAEAGKSKSHNAVSICSYIWAVSAKNGRPVTWFVGNGGKLDSKAFEKIEKFLADSGIRIEGVILDRGFAAKEVLDLIEQCGHRYVAMLKASSTAYKTMFGKYSAEIRWRVPYLLSRGGLFGIAEEAPLFGNSDRKACVGFYFNGLTGTKKSMDLISLVFDACDDVRKQISAGTWQEDICIPAHAKDFIRLAGKEGALEIQFTEKMQQSIDAKGYSAIASSETLSAQRISEIYDCRDISEKQFSVLKSQLGASVTRVRDDASVQAKLAVCFIAAIVRTDIERACLRLKLATNKMLREADRCVLTLMPSGGYSAIHDQPDRLKRLFGVFDLTGDHLDFFAEDVNHRKNPIHAQVRTMPPFIALEKRKPGRPRKKKSPGEADKPKRRP